MSKIIIGVHGLGNKPHQKILKKWWKRSIREGLQAIGHPSYFFKFELVYWAHFLHPVLLDPKIKNEDDPAYLKEPYAPGNVPVSPEKPGALRQKLLDYLEKQMDKLFLKKDLSIHFASVSDLIIKRFFSDLHCYYTETCINVNGMENPVQDAIREQLANILQKHRHKEILLIGHSMGSIICYDVLTQMAQDVNIDTFVTMGSPLGLPIIMSKIASEQKKTLVEAAKLATPENVVRNWFNFSDLRDRVAINYTLNDDYDENSRHIRAIDRVVANDYECDGKKNPHKIYGYLRTPEFAEVVHEFLNHGRSKTVNRVCEKINQIFAKLLN